MKPFLCPDIGGLRGETSFYKDPQFYFDRDYFKLLKTRSTIHAMTPGHGMNSSLN